MLGRQPVERRSRGFVPAAPRSPLGSPTQGCIHPPCPIHPFGQALGVNRGSGRGRVSRVICPADHFAPTVGGRITAGRFEHGGTRPADRERADTGRRPPRAGRDSGARLRPGRTSARHGFRRRPPRHGDHQPRGRRRSGPPRAARARRPQLCGDRRRRDPAPRNRSGARTHRGPRPRPASRHRARAGRDRHVCPDPRGRLARGPGAGQHHRDVHGDRSPPSPGRGTGVGDRHGRPRTRSGWAAGRPGDRSSTPRPER